MHLAGPAYSLKNLGLSDKGDAEINKKAAVVSERSPLKALLHFKHWWPRALSLGDAKPPDKPRSAVSFL